MLFTAVLCLATWEKLPTAGSAARAGDGVGQEPQVLVLSLCAPKQTLLLVGDGDVRFPPLLPDQLPAAGTVALGNFVFVSCLNS